MHVSLPKKKKKKLYSVSLNKRSTGPFALVHSNVWYAPLVSMYGHCYFVTFIDGETRATWVYLIKSKDEVLIFLKQTIKWWKLSLIEGSKLLGLTTGENIFHKIFRFTSLKMGLNHKPHVPMLQNRMRLLSVRTGTF